MSHPIHHALIFLIVSFCSMQPIQAVEVEQKGPAPSDRRDTNSIPTEIQEGEAHRIEVMRRIAAPTIAIFDRTGTGGGSGVIISSDGFALTNYHVVQPCGNFMKCGLADGDLVDAVVVGIDPTGDLALIKLVGRNDFPAAEMGDSDTVRAGQSCIAAGNPFLLATNFQPSISLGIVSGARRYQYPAGTLLEYTDCIQTDAAINPGNSGGPLFDLEGKLIGINGRCSFEKRGRVNVGVGYSISINQARNFLGHLKSGRIVDHATLGATVSSDEEGRVIVTNILESSDAYRRGLRFDDQIIAFGGRSIETVNAFKNVLGVFPQGWRVPLTFVRDGDEQTILVRLSGVHAGEELWELLEGPQPVVPPDQKDPKSPKKEAPKLPPPVPAETEGPGSELKSLFEARRGFANYHFNRIARTRIFQDWSAAWAVTSKSSRAPWRIHGHLENGDRFEFDLRDRDAFLNLPGGQYAADLTRDLDTQLQPDGSGGLLLALSLWRQLAIEGPTQFGEVYYLGLGPLHDDRKYNIVVATHRSVELQLYFEIESSELRAVELFPRSDLDPVAVVFSRYQNLPTGVVPGHMAVYRPDRIWGEFEIDSLETSDLTSENDDPLSAAVPVTNDPAPLDSGERQP